MVEEAELETLQLAIHLLAQVVFDGQGHPAGDHAPPIHEAPAQEHRAEDHEREHEQRVAVVGAQGKLVTASVACALVDRFDREAGQSRERDRHHHREAREQPGDRQAALVGAQKAK